MVSQPHTDRPSGSAWTDERLDDLVQVIRDGFARNEEDHRQFREEMRAMEARTEARFDQVDDRFDRMDDRFDRMDFRFDEQNGRNDDRFSRLESRFDSLQRTLVVGMFSLTTAMLATMVTVLLRV